MSRKSCSVVSCESCPAPRQPVADWWMEAQERRGRRYIRRKKTASGNKVRPLTRARLPKEVKHDRRKSTRWLPNATPRPPAARAIRPSPCDQLGNRGRRRREDCRERNQREGRKGVSAIDCVSNPRVRDKHPEVSARGTTVAYKRERKRESAAGLVCVGNGKHNRRHC